MKWKHIATLVQKDILLSIKDWELALIIFLPVISMTLVGYGIGSMDSEPSIPKVVISDLDQGKFTQYLEEQKTFKIVEKVKSWDQADQVLDEKNAHVAILIPSDFTTHLQNNKKPRVEMIFDADHVSRERRIQSMLKHKIEDFAGRKPLVELKSSFSKGTEISLQSYLLQFGLVLQIIMVCIMFLPLSVGEEKEKGCLEALVLSPATMQEIIVAKVVYTTGMCFVASLLMTMAYASKVTHLGLTIMYALFGALCFSAIGIAIALSAKNRKHGSFLGSAAMMVMVMPTSFKDIFPIVESLIVLLPSEWLMRGLRQLNATEATFADQALNFGLLLLAGVLASLWSLVALRKYDGSIE